MKGFIEIKETTYDDTVEYLRKMKLYACKLIKMLSQDLESYDRDFEDDDDDEYDYRGMRGRKNRGRYSY